jgi:hypothetical protein
MDFARITQESRVERFQERARTARKWSRLTFVCLIGACLGAIWQDRALAPQVHDRMQVVAGRATEFIENSESTRASLLAMSEFTGNGSQSEFGPITEALLKLRN